MENYQIFALLVFVPACVYFNWRAGYSAGVMVGINSAVALMEHIGAVKIVEIDGEQIVTLNGKPVDLENKTE